MPALDIRLHVCVRVGVCACVCVCLIFPFYVDTTTVGTRNEGVLPRNVFSLNNIKSLIVVVSHLQKGNIFCVSSSAPAAFSAITYICVY